MPCAPNREVVANKESASDTKQASERRVKWIWLRCELPSRTRLRTTSTRFILMRSVNRCPKIGQVDAQLSLMRAALVQPIWRDIRIQDSHGHLVGAVECETQSCVLIADDGEGHELYFGPAQSNFVLAYSGNPPVTFNIRGDSVGCFMAR